ncbi:MAG: peptidoglycan bridge formation glycyltransferase FemA/FemB family protein [Bacteroidetes bacterium]|nr:peptidoglycan bridge formation glycyltransferase FemA/FemB family protein [Bacteroidota bacterium]
MKLLKAEEFLSMRANDIDALPFCFQKDYLKLNKDTLILQKNNIFAPIKLSKNKFLNITQFQFPPIKNDGGMLKESEEIVFCEEAVQFISESKLAHRIIQPKNYALFKTKPEKSVSCAFGTYKVDLENKNNEQLLENMRIKYRYAIRQTQKLNVELKFGILELKPFLELHTETMDRTNAHKENHDSLTKELTALPNNSMLATVYIDNKIQCGAYIVYSKFGAYYFHAASITTQEGSAANKYLHYKIMCLMREKGVKQYDFVGARLSDISGTKLEGIQNFKKRFGSELVKGYLWKIDLDKTKCKTYDNLLKIKCKLKGTKFPIDIIDQEKNKNIVL